MVIHRQRKTPAEAGAGDASALTNPVIPLLPRLVQISDPDEQAQRVSDYTGYVNCRYGSGLGPAIEASGRRYRALTGHVIRVFKRGSKKPNPYTPLTCLLAQSSEIDVGISAESYHAYQERFAARRQEWGELGIMSSQQLSVIKGNMSGALGGFPDSHFDEITCRFPQETSGEFASLMLRKLNMLGSVNPQGASVLVGMKFPQGERLAKVFDGIIHDSLEGVEGYELKTSVHNVGGAGAPAKLWQIIKTQK